MTRNFLMVLTLLSPLGLASANAYAGKPCNVTLCLWEKMNGQSSDECKSPEKQFFNIVKKKKGSIRWGQTFNARKDFLNEECPAKYGASEHVEKVLNKFGKVKG